MPDRYPTRPERLAAQRRAAAVAARAVPPAPLNPPFPYRAMPIDAPALGAVPLWSVRLPEP